MDPFRRCDEGIIEKIMQQAASDEFVEFYNTKFVCKRFSRVADQAIRKKVSLENDNIRRLWGSEKHKVWFEKCLASENPEAMYIKGLELLFTETDPGQSLDYLKQSRLQGYVHGIYAYGLVCIVVGRRGEGVRVLKHFDLDANEDESLRLIRECRNKMKSLFGRISGFDYGGRVEWPTRRRCACLHNCLVSTRGRGSWDGNRNYCSCYSLCFWDHEAAVAFQRRRFLFNYN